jgi:hypothetical protein
LGLDIYHAHAKSEVDGKFFTVDQHLDEMKPLKPYFQQQENPHLDWERMFAARGLVHGNYRVMSMGTDGGARSFAFVDADAVGFDHPVRAVFSDEWQFPLLPKFLQRSRFRFPGSNRAPHFFGPFATVMKLETVIFYDVAGYQRNGVNEDFYHSFRPDDVTCMEHRVEAIYQATVPELREEFKRTFMDNWIDGRSFVLISY